MCIRIRDPDSFWSGIQDGKFESGIRTIEPKRWFLLFSFHSPFFLALQIFSFCSVLFSPFSFSLCNTFCYSFSSRIPDPDFFSISDPLSRIQILDPGVKKAPHPQNIWYLCSNVLPLMDLVDVLLMVRCVELVHEEMQRIIQHCGNEVQQEMLRLIALKSERLHYTPIRKSLLS